MQYTLAREGHAITPNGEHSGNCWCTAPCYTCGWKRAKHRSLCPDHPKNRARMRTMDQAKFDRLIPVGTWSHRS